MLSCLIKAADLRSDTCRSDGGLTWLERPRWDHCVVCALQNCGVFGKIRVGFISESINNTFKSLSDHLFRVWTQHPQKPRQQVFVCRSEVTDSELSGREAGVWAQIVFVLTAAEIWLFSIWLTDSSTFLDRWRVSAWIFRAEGLTYCIFTYSQRGGLK